MSRHPREKQAKIMLPTVAHGWSTEVGASVHGNHLVRLFCPPKRLLLGYLELATPLVLSWIIYATSHAHWAFRSSLSPHVPLRFVFTELPRSRCFASVAPMKPCTCHIVSPSSSTSPSAGRTRLTLPSPTTVSLVPTFVLTQTVAIGSKANAQICFSWGDSAVKFSANFYCSSQKPHVIEIAPTELCGAVLSCMH